jgi:circadian clock protein KaiB
VSDERGLVRLYVAGPGPRAEEAWRTVRAACQHVPGTRFDVQLVDVSERPDAGSIAGILLTPMLVRVRPGPERRWLGDFTNVAEVARALSGVEHD